MNTLVGLATSGAVLYIVEQFLTVYGLNMQGVALIALFLFVLLITVSALEHDVKELIKSRKGNGD